jgi:glutaredoxin-like protein
VTTTEPTAAAAVTVYWRPGCPYCRRLRADLSRTGLPITEIDIWADPSAAATVRAAAGGNETVPTVTIGEKAMVNPSAAQVLDAVQQNSPELVTERATHAVAVSRALQIAQWLIIIALVVASFALEAHGYGAWSWGLDGIAVAVWLTFRYLRR